MLSEIEYPVSMFNSLDFLKARNDIWQSDYRVGNLVMILSEVHSEMVQGWEDLSVYTFLISFPQTFLSPTLS